MKVLVSLCVLLPLAMTAPDAEPDAKSEADPGYGGHFGHRRYGWGGKQGYGYHGRNYARSYSHAHHPRPVQQCHTVYDTTYEKVCRTIHDKVCELVPTIQYRTEVDNVCTTVPEKVCVPTSNTITEQACSTHTEEACTTEIHTTVDTIVNQECQDIEHKICEETRVSQHTKIVGIQQHEGLVGHHVGAAPSVIGPHPVAEAFGVGAPAIAGLPAHGIAKRSPESEPDSEAEADSEAHGGNSFLLSRLGASPVVGPAPVAAGPVVGPATVSVGPPSCQVEVERICKDIPVQVPRQIEVPKCIPVPKTHCVPVSKVVPGPPACHDEPRQVCNPVSRQVPFEVPVQQCAPVAQQVCKDVPHKAARQVCNTSYHGYGGYGHGH